MSRRLPNSVHESRPWRIREIAPDFRVEDVWALPAQGRAEDFQALLELMAASDPANDGPLPVRVLWRIRELLGSLFGLGGVSAPAGERGEGTARGLPIPGTEEISLIERLPDDLRGTAAGTDFGALPFVPLYRTDVEFAAELSNRTVHAAMHLAWVERGDDLYEGQMAVYVKPRGTFGRAYMALIKPFRHAIVYPALMRQTERAWRAGKIPAGGGNRDSEHR